MRDGIQPPKDPILGRLHVAIGRADEHTDTIEVPASMLRDAADMIQKVRSASAWIVDNYGPKLRTDEKAYGSSHDVLMGRLIFAEDMLRIIDGDDRP